jgi:hypothetical protein
VSRPVLAVVGDLLFSSRIRETARRLGHAFRPARSVEELRQALAEAPGLVMIDLSARGIDLDQALAAVEAAGRPAPILGWTTHALWKETRPLHARCDRVITREQLTAELPELLGAYLGSGASATGPSAAAGQAGGEG